MQRCLETTAELSVRASSMLLKYIKLFGLEASFPISDLLERFTASGIIVHDMGGKYVLKGRRRQAAFSGVSQPNTAPTVGSAPV